MKPRLAELLLCPIDRTPLELIAWETTTARLTSEHAGRAERLGIEPGSLELDVGTGVLVNRARCIYYPIYRGVPRLLTFPTAVGSEFATRFHDRLRGELPDYTLPAESAMPGEENVLRTFSKEWLSYGWDGRRYWNLTAERWFECMRFVLDVDNKPITGQRVLEVGIGIGATADHLARTEECEVVGMDLGYAVDGAARHFGANPLFHVVQASAFAPPFADESFDFVYSFGVIHHTFSTQRAFQSLARLPKRRGGRLYIWVYSPSNERRTLVRRALMVAERAIRPPLSRAPEHVQTAVLLPLAPLYVGYSALQALRGKGRIRYGWREAMHAARDRFTPPYVHRHTREEVSEWFRAAGYADLASPSDRPKPDFVPIPFVASTGVEGTRA